MAKKRAKVIPIAWQTCTHCGRRYDEGNAMAHFHHAYGQCQPPVATEEED